MSTLRCFARLRRTKVCLRCQLPHPGLSDLPSQVAFHGPITQAAFLSRMGLAAMLERSLLKAKDEAERAKILKAAGRLVDTGPKGMGRQYQFLGLSTKPRDAEVYPFVAGIQ